MAPVAGRRAVNRISLLVMMHVATAPARLETCQYGTRTCARTGTYLVEELRRNEDLQKPGHDLHQEGWVGHMQMLEVLLVPGLRREQASK